MVQAAACERILGECTVADPTDRVEGCAAENGVGTGEESRAIAVETALYGVEEDGIAVAARIAKHLQLVAVLEVLRSLCVWEKQKGDRRRRKRRRASGRRGG